MLNELELKETALVSAAFVAREEKRGRGERGNGEKCGRKDGRKEREKGEEGKEKMEVYGVCVCVCGGGGGGGRFLPIKREILF